jgi:hypothetical protein
MFRERGCEPPTPSSQIACGLQVSVDFHNRLNLVRDQGVGGSNPLSPTNLFNHINCISGLPSNIDGVEINDVEIVDGGCILDFPSSCTLSISNCFSSRKFA